MPAQALNLDKAQAPLKWFVGGLATALAIGGLLYTSVYRIGVAEAAITQHEANIKDLQKADAQKETRLQLVERAVLSLEKLANKQ